MNVLISVQNLAEALDAAAAGADFIDLKDPHHGALGALALDDIAAIVRGVRRAHPGVLVPGATADRRATRRDAHPRAGYVDA